MEINIIIENNRTYSFDECKKWIGILYSSKYSLIKTIIINGALNAKNSGYAKPSLSFSSAAASFSLSSDGKYYVSSNITVSASSIKDNVKLSLAQVFGYAKSIFKNEITKRANGIEATRIF